MIRLTSRMIGPLSWSSSRFSVPSSSSSILTRPSSPLQLGDRLAEVVPAAGVDPVQQRGDLGLAGQDGADLGLEQRGDLVHGVVVERLAGRDQVRPLQVDPDAHQVVLAGQAEGDLLDELLRHVLVAQVSLVGPERLAVDHRQEALFGHPAPIPQDPVEADVGLLLLGQGVLDLLLGQGPFPDQRSQDPPSHVCCLTAPTLPPNRGFTRRGPWRRW